MKLMIALLVLVTSLSTFAFTPEQECKDAQGNILKDSISQVTKIIHSNANRPQIFVTGTITKILPEDHSGLPHQKYSLKVSNDINLAIVSNLDFGRIPLVVGKSVSICGEFKRVGPGMVHWTHFDPHGGHADGFTIADGKLYGDKEVSEK